MFPIKTYVETFFPNATNNKKLDLDDFIVLSEFCEQSGPIPLEVYPVWTDKININDFVLQITSTDFQGDTTLSNSQDTQFVVKIQKSSAYAYVHHFTLFDVKARGFVRPVCLSYVSADHKKLMNRFSDMLKLFSSITSILKNSNKLLFLKELTTSILDLDCSLEKSLLDGKQKRRCNLIRENVQELLVIGKQLITSLTEMEKAKFKRQLKNIYKNDNENKNENENENESESESDNESDNESENENSNENEDIPIVKDLENEQIEYDLKYFQNLLPKNYKPNVVGNLNDTDRLDKVLRPMKTMCNSESYQMAEKKILKIHKKFQKEEIVNIIEDEFSPSVHPRSMLLKIGNISVINFHPNSHNLSSMLIEDKTFGFDSDFGSELELSTNTSSPVSSNFNSLSRNFGMNWSTGSISTNTTPIVGTPLSQGGDFIRRFSFENDENQIQNTNLLERFLSESNIKEKDSLIKNFYNIENEDDDDDDENDNDNDNDNDTENDDDDDDKNNVLKIKKNLERGKKKEILNKELLNKELTKLKEQQSEEEREKRNLTEKSSEKERGKNVETEKGNSKDKDFLKVKGNINNKKKEVEDSSYLNHDQFEFLSPKSKKNKDYNKGFRLFIKRFKRGIPHILFSLLTGRPFLIIGSNENKHNVKLLIQVLSLFIPGKLDRKSIIRWNDSKQIQFKDLAKLRLAGISRKLSISSAVLRFCSILDMDTNTLSSPLCNKSIYIQKLVKVTLGAVNENSFLAHLHQIFLDLAMKAYIYFHLCCVGFSPIENVENEELILRQTLNLNFDDEENNFNNLGLNTNLNLNLNSNLNQNNFLNENNILSSKKKMDPLEVWEMLQVKRDDKQIIKYLIRVIQNQQFHESLTKKYNSFSPSIHLDFRTCATIKLN
ncbi:hypothetical protein M0813_23776 [Anaeramoeba flamelloides]|uniref:UDENN FLCN/SMCR8-type domain-containing protein n=1 Tax=Anaeramoeba flamelloides TaxID=1746091 RepID=A0ABQ8Y8Y5_9EUKA|nr:hypothetical protein M0813_23776 [Anaeramoeba flamelloides]